MVETEKWLTREEAANLLSVHPRTIDKLVRDQVLQRYRISGTRSPRFRIEDVRALVVPNGGAK